MNPHQKNKIDVGSLSPEEQRLFRLYGKLPSRSDHFAKHLKERKYFDSGDYAMSKAGKGDGVDTGTVGSEHPVPENIPHNTSGSPGGVGSPGLNKSGSMSSASGVGILAGGSPAKESSSGLQRETSAEEAVEDPEAAAQGQQQQQQQQQQQGPLDDAAAGQQGIPIRS